MNQHYVPQVYLRNFALQKGKEFYVDVFDRKLERPFCVNTRKICSEIDLYTLEEGNPFARDLLAVENIYSQGIEPLFKRVYELLVDKTIFHLNSLHRSEILIAIFQFYFRNPAYYKTVLRYHQTQINKLWQQAKANGDKGMSYKDDDFSFREWSLEQIQAHFEHIVISHFKTGHLHEIGQLSNFQERTIVEVIHVRDQHEFITSDNPLIFNDRAFTSEYAYEKTQEFSIILNKKTALKLYHDNRKRPDLIHRCYLPDLSIAEINTGVIEKSSRFIITTKENYNRQLEMERNFLLNTDIEMKIDMIRQLLTKFPENTDNTEMRNVFRTYLSKYERDGTLSDLEQYEMVCQLREISRRFIQKIAT